MINLLEQCFFTGQQHGEFALDQRQYLVFTIFLSFLWEVGQQDQQDALSMIILIEILISKFNARKKDLLQQDKSQKKKLCIFFLQT